jgi:hypothetical protein
VLCAGFKEICFSFLLTSDVQKNIHKLATFTKFVNKQLPLVEIRNAQRKAIKKAVSKKYS